MGIKGFKHSEETKKKMSKTRKGKKRGSFTKEWVDNLRKSFNKRIEKEENHPRWSGDKVGYRALHYWVEKQLGKPKICEDCEDSSLKQNRYHWANISGDYKRVVTDWRRLCSKCHGTYDRVKRQNH